MVVKTEETKIKKIKAKEKAKAVVYYATGRRKEAVARVRLYPGKGDFSINGRPLEEYFGREVLKRVALKPFAVTSTIGKFDVVASIVGGGLSGHAGALRHGIARALLEANEEFKDELKKTGLLTRDPRMKERKKYGLKKARKRPQFSKR